MMAINARHEYPRELRNMFFEQKRYENLNDRMLVSKNGYSKGTEVNDEERYKHSSIHNSMRRVDFRKDILPFIYIIIHPNIRDINTQLFTKHEK